MGEVKWIKLIPDIFDDDKALLIENMPETKPIADSILIIWFKLLCLAGKQNNSGVFVMGNKKPYTDEMLAAIFRRDLKIVSLALDTFEQFGMIEIVDNVITIPNWDKHQSLDAYEKKKERDRKLQAERRARQKALITESSDNRLTSDDCSPDVAVSEEEEERDKEKEFHSFVHSSENAYIQKKVEESELEGEDAEVYRKELIEGLKLKYMGGTLGQGIIFMSDEQFSDLCDKLDLDEIERYFGIIVDCERRGKHYKKKSHYQAVLDMAERDRRIK